MAKAKQKKVTKAPAKAAPKAAAKPSTKPATKAAPGLDMKEVRPGTNLKFTGYKEAFEAGVQPLLTENEIVTVKHTAKNEDGSYEIQVHRFNDTGVVETIMPNEAAMATDAEVEQAEATVGKAPAAKTPVQKKPVAAATKADTKAVKETAKEEAKPAPAKAKGLVPAAKAAPARTKEEAEVAPVVHMPSVKKLLKGIGTAAGLNNQAKEMLSAVEQHYFMLGGVLAEIRQSGAFKKLGGGYEDFAAYCMAELGMKYRKAMYLIEIYTVFSIAGIDEERLGKIGWTKIRMLAKYVTADNVDALLKKASSMSREDLEGYIADEYVDVKGAEGAVKEKRTSFKFSVFGDQAELVRAAEKRAGELTGKPDDVSANLGFIVLDWAEMQKGVEFTVEQGLELFNKKYGTKLSLATGTMKAPEAKPAKAAVPVKKKGAPVAKAKSKAKPKAKAKLKKAA